MSKFPFRRCRSGSNSMLDYIAHQNYNGDGLGGRRMVNQRLRDVKTLHSKDLYAHYGCVNAVEFSHDGEYLVSGGDDKRVLLWNMNKALSCTCKPKTMKGEHHSNIFCLSFDAEHTKIFSAGNDEQVILHDVITGETLDVFLHDEAVYGLSVDPVNTNLFASACDDGRILIWDIRSSATDAFTLASCSSAFHAVAYNPTEPRLLATANAKEGVNLWDIRNPRTCLIKYGRSLTFQGAMSVCFNKMGTQVLALRRRLAPVLYELSSTQPAAEFDHAEYYNSCTMKSCCFAGENDQYVLSGSDDFKLYMWKVPDDVCTKKSQWVNEAQLVLRGHRSIVNQVRYNGTFGIFASSGVEKIIKLWSTFPINSRLESNYVTDKDGIRKVYSHEEYINLVLESGQFMTHDYSHHSVQEDPRMMAFFDSLVQRDIEGWTSDSSGTSAIPSNFNSCYEVQSSGSTTSTSSSTVSSSSSDEESDADKHESRRYSDSDVQKLLSSNVSDGPTPRSSNAKESFTLDHISELIAKKRRQQHLRNARIVNALRKEKKQSRSTRNKKQSTSQTYYLAADRGSERSSTSESAQRMLSSVIIGLRVQDKRKLLQKKRARLLRLARISDHSSSDSDNEVTKSADSNVETGSSLISNPVPSQNGVHYEDTTHINSTNVNNGVVELIEPVENKDQQSEAPPVPHTSTNGLNGSTSSSIPLDSNGSLFLQSKNGKRHSRNYRKRSADDMQDDS